MKSKTTLITFVTTVLILCLVGLSKDIQVNASGAELDKVPVEYQQYNLDRMLKSAVQTLVSETEINALLHVAGVQEWDMKGNERKLGKFGDINEIFIMMEQDARISEEKYEAYINSMYGPIEDSEYAETPSALDYLAVSDISITYYYSSDRFTLSQVIRIETEDRVIRAVLMYHQDGTVMEYYGV